MDEDKIYVVAKKDQKPLDITPKGDSFPVTFKEGCAYISVSVEQLLKMGADVVLIPRG